MKVTIGESSFSSLFFYWREVVFTNSAKWAYPIFRDVFKCCSWSNASIFVANCWIIDVSANIANVLFHLFLFLVLIIIFIYSLMAGNRVSRFLYCLVLVISSILLTMSAALMLLRQA